MGLFRKNCDHSYSAKRKSNVIQLDFMGYPMRLCVCKCEKCGKIKYMWIDEPLSAKAELENGSSVLVEWREIDGEDKSL